MRLSGIRHVLWFSPFLFFNGCDLRTVVFIVNDTNYEVIIVNANLEKTLYPNEEYFLHLWGNLRKEYKYSEDIIEMELHSSYPNGLTIQFEENQHQLSNQLIKKLIMDTPRYEKLGTYTGPAYYITISDIFLILDIEI
ncbi:MAG: hypothetical protein LBQ14_08055 [Treponema sp.]|jgi:hypothetical protein|nr:hypothetical protein [Treponema sp.]